MEGIRIVGAAAGRRELRGARHCGESGPRPERRETGKNMCKQMNATESRRRASRWTRRDVVRLSGQALAECRWAVAHHSSGSQSARGWPGSKRKPKHTRHGWPIAGCHSSPARPHSSADADPRTGISPLIPTGLRCVFLRCDDVRPLRWSRWPNALRQNTALLAAAAPRRAAIRRSLDPH
jgi:hypothetical protein